MRLRGQDHRLQTAESPMEEFRQPPRDLHPWCTQSSHELLPHLSLQELLQNKAEGTWRSTRICLPGTQRLADGRTPSVAPALTLCSHLCTLYKTTHESPAQPRCPGILLHVSSRASTAAPSWVTHGSMSRKPKEAAREACFFFFKASFCHQRCCECLSPNLRVS